MTEDEARIHNAAFFEKLMDPGNETKAVNALNEWTMAQIRGALQRCGIPRRSFLMRIMPPIPVPPDGIIPDWETGALLYEIVESLWFDDKRTSRMTARELWDALCHEVRYNRRKQTIGLYDRYRFGMRVATSLLSQIRSLHGS